MTKSGFTLVEILIVVAIIVLLGAIAIPQFIKARDATQQAACIKNLELIESAKEKAALAEHWDATAPVVTTIVDQYIKEMGKPIPQCPACKGPSYTYGKMNERPVCNYNGGMTHKLPVIAP